MSALKEATSSTKKSQKEIITPHRLSIAVLINEYFKLRGSGMKDGLSKKYNRDFCLLLLSLIQSPDLSFASLQNILIAASDILFPILFNNFNETLASFQLHGICCMMNCINDVGKLISKDTDNVGPIHKNSIIGFYLRRLLINFDKLTFSEVTTIYSAYQKYYETDKALEPTNAKRRLGELLNNDWYLNKNLWSRRQAELFIASQEALISGNEEKALEPKELHKHIRNLLKTNPDLAEAHFLNYLNYLRVQEFCGAIRSLYHSFDRSVFVDVKGNVDEKSKGFRFAALNLAVLHFHFGHKEEALAAFKEAIMLAQESNDNVCLQHALSWLYCLTDTNKDKLIQHSILKSLDLNLTYTVSLGIQSFVQYAGISGGMPKYIFETITRSDILNSQRAYSDLTCISYAQKAALWLFYGKTEMCSLWSQLLLHINTDSSLGKSYFGEASCQAICNIANCLLMEGEYTKAYAVLTLAKDRFSHEPISHIWMLNECIFTFVRALHHEKWVEAEAAAQRVAVYDVWESRLRMAELFLQKRDFCGAQKCVREVLDCRNEPGLKLRIDYHVRAMILLGEIQYTSNFTNVIPPMAFNVCLAYANDFHLDYLDALIHLHLANIQLLMGMPTRALKLLNEYTEKIFKHGGIYDRARATLLFLKCTVASVGHLDEKQRMPVVKDSADKLNKVIIEFNKVEAYSRVKDVLYLQACLYNEVNLVEERNRCAMKYRLCEVDHPSKNNVTLVTYL